eukprot:1052318-Pleurochrysis_carterae.AAC.1
MAAAAAAAETMVAEAVATAAQAAATATAATTATASAAVDDRPHASAVVRNEAPPLHSEGATQGAASSFLTPHAPD